MLYTNIKYMKFALYTFSFKGWNKCAMRHNIKIFVLKHKGIGYRLKNLRKDINPNAFKLVIVTVKNLLKSINMTQYQFALSVKRYIWICNNRGIYTRNLKEFGAGLHKTSLYPIFRYIRIPYWKDFFQIKPGDINQIRLMLKKSFYS